MTGFAVEQPAVGKDHFLATGLAGATGKGRNGFGHHLHDGFGHCVIAFFIASHIRSRLSSMGPRSAPSAAILRFTSWISSINLMAPSLRPPNRPPVAGISIQR